MNIRNIHPKLEKTIQIMLSQVAYSSMPFYGNFNLFLNFIDRPDIETCAVNVTTKGMNFFYNSEFLEGLTQGETNFVVIHENFHLLWDHPSRSKGYDLRLANIAQDMIINHIIVSDINSKFIEIPKDKDGKHICLFIPLEYKGELVFEILYNWLKEEKEKRKDKVVKDPDYGPFSIDPTGKKKTIDSFSLDYIFDNIDNNDGMYLDKHLDDEVPSEYRNANIKNIINNIKTMIGSESNNIDLTLGKLRKRKKDYLKSIKRSISVIANGKMKNKTILRPNRRGIEGLRGKRKYSSKINCILDTSGSMDNSFEKALSYIYRSDIEVNLIEADIKINNDFKIKSKKSFNALKISGLGGTIMQTGIDYVVENYNAYNTVLLTDGYTDSLDCSRLKGKLLIISMGKECPILKSNGKIKQIVVND